MIWGICSHAISLTQPSTAIRTGGIVDDLTELWDFDSAKNKKIPGMRLSEKEKSNASPC